LSYFVIGTVAMVTGVVTGNVVSSGFMQSYCPPAMRGRIGSCASVVNYGSIPIGALAGGLLAHSLGFRPALWLIFGLFVASASILLASPLRGMRDLPTHADVVDRAAEAS
jgi:predicted MFS family arabinose efflux permease